MKRSVTWSDINLVRNIWILCRDRGRRKKGMEARSRKTCKEFDVVSQERNGDGSAWGD